ncbi:MAG: 1-deoxy-D-xylulose-5-phosphate synthase, partial [Oscillospiraceae bacterium]
GFCRPDESEHDAFISGHSSNSVSAALGIATAMKLKGDNHHAIAVLGDGAFTGGMVFEGLNNAGKSKTNIILVLNHNEMSISKNVGGLAKYLSSIRTTEHYTRTKRVILKILDKIPVIGKPLIKIVKGSKTAVKSAVLHSTLFEELGFEFVGPVDGHNIKELEQALRAAQSYQKPVVLQIKTTKGKGYEPAEKNPGAYHGVGSFDVKTGSLKASSKENFSKVFGKELVSLAKNDNTICAVTAAMKYGTGLQYFSKEYPERFFDVGIAEEHAVTFCGGLASMGMKPVFAVYSSFLQRSYDQIIHDLAICNTHCVLCVDRAGIVGSDGETHQGLFDVPMLTSIPHVTIYSPANYDELRLCLRQAVYAESGVVAVRYPRGSQGKIAADEKPSLSYSYTEKGSDILLVTYGRLYDNVVLASEILEKNHIQCDVLRLTKIYPLIDDVVRIMSRYRVVAFFEESYHSGCVGEKYAAASNHTASFAINGFVKHGEVDNLLDENGLSAEKIAMRVRDLVKYE